MAGTEPTQRMRLEGLRMAAREMTEARDGIQRTAAMRKPGMRTGEPMVIMEKMVRTEHPVQMAQEWSTRLSR